MATLELEARLDNLIATAQTETASIDIYAPITEREECPICLIPHPINDNETRFMPCCGKKICSGCVYKNVITQVKKGISPQKAHDDYKCAFCRQKFMDEIKALKKLMKKNNPEAFTLMAFKYQSGDRVFQSDTKALQMYIRAAELGDASAYGLIGTYYQEGILVEQNKSKAIEFYEVAAKKGAHLLAHRSLARFHGSNGDARKSIEHLKVVASAGNKKSMDDLMKAYKNKLLSKEDLSKTLRAYQTSSNETRSKDRDDARLMDV